MSTRLFSLVALLFLVATAFSQSVDASWRCRNDFDCGKYEYCVRVPGDNNNYCAPTNHGGWGFSCQSDYDCDRDEHCVHVPGSNNNYCAPDYGHGGGFSCLRRGQLCGNNDSACCSGDCVNVKGDNNNYCR